MNKNDFSEAAEFIVMRRPKFRKTSGLRKEFKSVKKKILENEHYKPPRHYQWHHIIPLSLGGSNARENIVPCEPELHKLIHEFIDDQCGDKILIPFFRVKTWEPELCLNF